VSAASAAVTARTRLMPDSVDLAQPRRISANTQACSYRHGVALPG
jgi:hypothetical protein